MPIKQRQDLRFELGVHGGSPMSMHDRPADASRR
jgi:hypothetical protein